MYQPGKLQIAMLDEDGFLTWEEGVRPCVFLPHSCEEWVIGGPEQIRALIHDLEAALVTLSVPHGFRTIPAPTPEMIPNEPLLRGEVQSRKSGPTGGGSDT